MSLNKREKSKKKASQQNIAIQDKCATKTDEMPSLARSKSEPAWKKNTKSLGKRKILATPEVFDVQNATEDSMRAEILRVQSTIKKMTLDSKCRSTSEPRIEAWNDRFWVTISKANDILSPYQRQFFGSLPKDVEWAHRDAWRGFRSGGTEAHYACVKTTSDKILRNLTQYDVKRKCV